MATVEIVQLAGPLAVEIWREVDMHAVARFVYGDKTDLQISLKNVDGTAFDLTGATAITLVMKPTKPGAAVELSGSISGSATLGVVLVTAPGADTGANPGARGTIDFDARLKWTQSANVYWGRYGVKVSVEVFP